MSRVYHLVPHTHWDREWYLTFQQFRIRLVRLMDRLSDILVNDDGYAHFMLDGQALPLEDYLQIRPERADELAYWVRAGRLSIGPWYVLADEFLVAPESLIRNLMLGDRVCRRFGASMPVGYVPDLFGHISQLPQIFRGFDIESSVLRRGLAEEPVELWWEAPDGSRVLVCYLRDGYDNATRLPMTDPEAFVAAIQGATDRLAPHVGSGQVLLMAGNDHQEPDPRLPGLVAYANDGRLGDDRLVHSSLPAYVASVREATEERSLVTVKGELRSPQRHHLLPGVLSTRMWIKQRNDAIETLLTRWAEPFAAWAELLDVGDTSLSESHTHLSGHEPLAGVQRTAPLIRHAWRMLLENHPHDSICGCSVDQVHREMALRFDQAEQVAEEIAALSLAAIADQVDTSQDGLQPLVVFNPTGGTRTDVVTARLCLPEAPEGLEVVGPDGRVLPHQVATEPVEGERLFFYREATPDEMGSYLSMVRGGRLLNHIVHQVQVRPSGREVEVLLTIGQRGTPNRAQVAMAQAQIEDLIAQGNVSRFIVRTVMAEPSDLTFVAPELPPHGYATFTIRPAQRPAASRGEASPSPAPLALENDLFALQVNPSDGTITLTDKASGVVYPGLNRFVDGGDRGDEYNYCQPEQDRIVAGPVAPPNVCLVRHGPVWQTLEVALVYRLPRSLRPDREGRAEETVDVPIVSRVSLYAGVPRVEFETTVDNQAQDHRLRVHFPVPVGVDHGYTEAHFHVARRPVPQVSAEVDTSAWIEQPVPTVPQRGWADVSDGQVGLMVANRGLPEVEFIPGDDGTTIALTLLRCVGWLSRDDLPCRQGRAGPLLPTPEAQCPGRHTFHYALIPHRGRWEDARAQAEAFRAPLRAIVTEARSGPLPPSASLVQADPPCFALTAIKQPEDDSAPGLIVRGVNLSDEPATVRLRPWRAFERATRTNLNEAPLESLSLDGDGAVTFSARPWEIVTTRWAALSPLTPLSQPWARGETESSPLLPPQSWGGPRGGGEGAYLAGSHDLRLSAWGPYTKRYIGVSHIPDVAAGLRFDLSVFPGLYRRSVVSIPNVAWESGYHPWEAAPDLSYFSHRHDILWKDQLYCDVAFCRLSEEAVLIRCACVNNTAERQGLALHYMASLHFPPRRPNDNEPIRPGRVELPAGAIWVDGLAYETVHYVRSDPRATLTWDGQIRGEIRQHGFVDGQGLGQGFGQTAGDSVTYRLAVPQAMTDARLLLRHRLTRGAALCLRLSGAVSGDVELVGTGELSLAEVPVSGLGAGEASLTITSCDGAEIQIDGLALVPAASADAIRFPFVTWNPVPERSSGPRANTLLLQYEHVEGVYGLAWGAEPFTVREFLCDDLDSTLRRMTHEHTYTTLHGPGDGHYTNVFMRPIFLEPHSERAFYGLVCSGDTSTVQQRLAAFDPFSSEWDAVYAAARSRAVALTPSPAGEAYRFSQERMAATVLTNVVYPVRTRGTWIRHYTPGRWWDSLYTWDSGFIGFGLLELDVERAIDNLNAYLTEPGERDAAFIHHGSPVPTQFYLFLELWNRTQSHELLAYFYPRLQQYHRFLAGRYGSSTTRSLRSNLLRTWDYFYNSGGWDDYPPQVYVRQQSLQATVAPVVNTAQAIRTAKILRMAALALGEDTAEYDEDIAVLSHALQTYAWNEEAGYFGYVQHDAQGNPMGILRHDSGANYNMGMDGATPLIADICTPEQERRLVGRLMSEEGMWTKYGLTTVDQSAPYYRPDGYWNGGVWMPHQWFFWKAFLDMGRADEAHRIARTALDVWKKEVESSYNCYEHFVVHTGQGAGWHHFGGLSTPVLCWYGTYFRPGRLTTGLDAWVETLELESNNKGLVSRLRFFGQAHRAPVVIATLKASQSYTVTWEGRPAVYHERYPWVLEVSLPAGVSSGELVMRAECAGLKSPR